MTYWVDLAYAKEQADDMGIMATEDQLNHIVAEIHNAVDCRLLIDDEDQHDALVEALLEL